MTHDFPIIAEISSKINKYGWYVVLTKECGAVIYNPGIQSLRQIVQAACNSSHDAWMEIDDYHLVQNSVLFGENSLEDLLLEVDEYATELDDDQALGEAICSLASLPTVPRTQLLTEVTPQTKSSKTVMNFTLVESSSSSAPQVSPKVALSHSDGKAALIFNSEFFKNHLNGTMKGARVRVSEDGRSLWVSFHQAKKRGYFNVAVLKPTKTSKYRRAKVDISDAVNHLSLPSGCKAELTYEKHPSGEGYIVTW